MAFFFFDESIHDQAGFILGSWVMFAEDPDRLLRDSLGKAGLPKDLEFHSANRMDGNGSMRRLRDTMQALLPFHARVSVLIASRSERSILGRLALRSLDQTLRSNGLLEGGAQHEFFLDEGLFSSTQAADAVIDELRLRDAGRFQVEQKSHAVRGIQFADLVAHTCGQMMKDALGLLRKEVRAGENSGYDPDSMMSLGFELWASVRYCFFGRSPEYSVEDHKKDVGVEKMIEMMSVEVKGRGLFLSEGCSSQLREAAEARFGSMYLGCIH